MKIETERLYKKWLDGVYEDIFPILTAILYCDFS